MKKYFAVAYIAHRYANGGRETTYGSDFVHAYSEAEAVGMTLAFVKKQFPSSDEWHSHDAGAREMSLPFLESIGLKPLT